MTWVATSVMPLYHGMKDKKVLSSSSPLSSFLSPSSKHPTATADLHPAERGRSAMLREGVIIPQVRRSRRKVRSEVGRDRGESQLAEPVGMHRSVGECATRHLECNSMQLFHQFTPRFMDCATSVASVSAPCRYPLCVICMHYLTFICPGPCYHALQIKCCAGHFGLAVVLVARRRTHRQQKSRKNTNNIGATHEARRPGSLVLFRGRGSLTTGVCYDHGHVTSTRREGRDQTKTKQS